MAVLHGIFVVFKFIFGLGALLALPGHRRHARVVRPALDRARQLAPSTGGSLRLAAPALSRDRASQLALSAQIPIDDVLPPEQRHQSA